MAGLRVVLDVGKTLSKLTLWSPGGELLDRRTYANVSIAANGYAALDADGIEQWLAEQLAQFAVVGEIDAIIPVAHGAAAAIVRDRRLACPVMDYESPIPPDLVLRYRQDRAPFAESGSPALPAGLNLGAQLHYLESLHPGLLDAGAMLLLWPQYWAWRLSGVAASEATSLGCHSDLWNPTLHAPSSLAVRCGWADRLPPLRQAGEALGTILPAWAARTGLPATTRIHCGLHDSNAALLAARGFPEIADGEATVLSTGTWFVAMRTPAIGAAINVRTLDEARDCLVNVDVAGQPVPSARFMGGREIEILTGIDTRRIDIAPDQPRLLAALPLVVARNLMALPSFAPGSGPFPHAAGRWSETPADDAERRAAVGLYAALVADVSLDLIGACGTLLVEGRFAEAQVFVRALAALRPQTKVYTANTHNDVSFGALRLLDPGLAPCASLVPVEPLALDLEAYRLRWRLETLEGRT